LGYSENATVTNAESYCTINALNVDYVGFIIATPRSTTVVASNCKVGGTLLGEYNTEDESYKTTHLDESNYHNYIYGSGEATDWAGSENYDGCTFLSAEPTIQ
jgi:hypothetical protein